MSFTAVPYEVPSIADFEIPVKTSDASWISEYLGNVATPGKSVLVHRTPESTLSQTSPQQPTSRDPDPNTAEEFLQRHFADWRFTPMERDVDAMKKDAADLVKRGDYLGALDQYRSVLVQKPDDVECLVAMARIFQNHCYDRDFAEECYLRALAIERYDPDLFFEYGMLLYTGRGEGHIVKATDQFKRAVELSNLIPPRVQLAKCYSLRGRKPEAKEVLEEALRIDPSNREALEYLEKVRGY
jgi:tetratricopeptide (TPR) repeat protein